MISGNYLSGIYIENENPNTDIVIFNNYIGMVDDTTPEPNITNGITVIKNSGILNIGGDYLTQGNLIAGNQNVGIYIEESITRRFSEHFHSMHRVQHTYRTWEGHKNLTAYLEWW